MSSSSKVEHILSLVPQDKQPHGRNLDLDLDISGVVLWFWFYGAGPGQAEFLSERPELRSEMGSNVP